MSDLYSDTYSDTYGTGGGTADPVTQPTPPQYQLAGKWSRAGDYTGPLEDLTQVVAKNEDIVVTWGRAEPRATADVAATRMTFKLLNHTRQFSPENTASPIYGHIVPGVPFRLTVGDPNTTPQEGGGAPTGTPKTATLTDNFRAVDTAKWPGNTSTAAALGWRGRVTMPGTVGPSEKWSTEPTRYDLVASYVGVELAELPTATGAVGLHAVNSFSPEQRVMIGREGGNLLMRKVEGGTVSDTTLTYDPVLHRWVRLAHDGTSVLWQTSSNGLTWTTRRTATTTVDCSSVIVSLEVTWQTTVGTGRTAWANLNVAPLTPLTSYTPPPFPTGVLRVINDTYTDKADDHYTSGDRIGMYETFWDRYEGAADGTYSSAYATQITNETNLIRSAGLKLTLGLGLTYPPTWVGALTNSKFVNESGTSSTQVNPVFSQVIRDKFEDYLDHVNSQVGFTNCWSIRINAGTDGELLYPSSGLWGYDVNAKGGANLPATVTPSPYPTWTPGTGTTTQAAEWMEWYLDSLADCASWQMRYIRSLGYTGWFEVVTPGSGTRPSVYATEVAARFSGYSATTGVGAIWHKLYQKIAVKAGAIVYVSSMADNSGSPANDVPTGTDTSVGITSSGGDSWSAYRWLVRIANEYGMPNGGENPGRGALSDTYYLDTTSTGMTAKLLAQSAGGKALVTYWAHGVEHWTGSPGTRTALGTSWVSRTGTLNTTGPGTPPNPPST